MPKLTKRFVDLVQPLEKDRFEWDEEISGFGLRVKPSGKKSYILQYRQDGKSRRMTLGRHGVITAEQARYMARLRLGEVVHGDDPALARREERNAPTVAELAADYLERHAVPNKRPTSVRDDRVNLDKIILPALGDRKVKAITRRDIEPILIGMKATPYRANRVRALVSKMFSLAVGWGWRADNPVLGIPKYQEEKRERWLNQAELKRLFDVLAAHPNQKAANAVRLLVLTGARKHEVLSATWDQIDLDREVWTKPAHTTKQKRTEHTPISKAAAVLLNAMATQRDPKSNHLFPGNGPDGHIGDLKSFWEEVRLVAGFQDVRIHDLRHTFASHLVSGGVSLPIVGRLLGHTQPQTTQRYAHLADDPLREAANKFMKK